MKFIISQNIEELVNETPIKNRLDLWHLFPEPRNKNFAVKNTFPQMMSADL